MFIPWLIVCIILSHLRVIVWNSLPDTIIFERLLELAYGCNYWIPLNLLSEYY
jgi:hypothetical protein